VDVSQRRRLATLTQRAQIELAVQRLERFASLERDYRGQLNDAGVRLVRASTFSAYCDCRSLGVGKRADQILTRACVEAAPVAALETAGAV
jgi:hypothetical protein